MQKIVELEEKNKFFKKIFEKRLTFVREVVIIINVADMQM